MSLPRSLFDFKETYSHREEMHVCTDEDPRLCELESARSDLFGMWIPPVNSFDMSDVLLEAKLLVKVVLDIILILVIILDSLSKPRRDQEALVDIITSRNRFSPFAVSTLYNSMIPSGMPNEQLDFILDIFRSVHMFHSEN